MEDKVENDERVKGIRMTPPHQFCLITQLSSIGTWGHSTHIAILRGTFARSCNRWPIP